MDFRVGRPAQIGNSDQRARGSQEPIEAKLLAIRQPRIRSLARSPERRQAGRGRDPRSGRVLVLMIPDGQQLPAGLENGGYRVFLRFVRR